MSHTVGWQNSECRILQSDRILNGTYCRVTIPNVAYYRNTISTLIVLQLKFNWTRPKTPQSMRLQKFWKPVWLWTMLQQWAYSVTINWQCHNNEISFVYFSFGRRFVKKIEDFLEKQTFPLIKQKSDLLWNSGLTYCAVKMLSPEQAPTCLHLFWLRFCFLCHSARL
jgi:hypothetical protein